MLLINIYVLYVKYAYPNGICIRIWYVNTVKCNTVP